MDHLDWYPGFELYKFYMKGRRLAVRFTQAEIADNGFIALYAEIDPALLPRPPQARGFALHFSLGYMSSRASRSKGSRKVSSASSSTPSTRGTPARRSLSCWTASGEAGPPSSTLTTPSAWTRS